MPGRTTIATRPRGLSVVALVVALVVDLVLVTMPPAARAADVAMMLTPWNGEFFSQRQGGLYVKLVAQGFAVPRATRVLTSTVEITVYDRLERKIYKLAQQTGPEVGAPGTVWKLPSGKYEIQSVVIADPMGVKRAWTPGLGERRSFVVKRQCLSNLGIWRLGPSGKADLKLAFVAAPNTWRETTARPGALSAVKDSSVAAVLDGFTGLIQTVVGGKDAVRKANTDYGTSKELRATVTFTRQIAMFYRLDLRENNRYARPVANVLDVHDGNLRRCYTDRLAVDDSLKGEVRFKFILSPRTGTMINLKHVGGTLADPKLVECLYYELAATQFPVPETMLGELTYIFDVR